VGSATWYLRQVKLYGKWNSHKCVAEESSLLTCYALSTSKYLLTFQFIVLPSFPGTSSLRTMFFECLDLKVETPLYCVLGCFTLTMEALPFLETVQLFLSCHGVTSKKTRLSESVPGKYGKTRWDLCSSGTAKSSIDTAVEALSQNGHSVECSVFTYTTYRVIQT
jgi:hypothetical protein